MGTGSTKERTQQIAYQRDFLGSCWNSPYGQQEAAQFLPSRWMGVSKSVMELHTGNHCFVLRAARHDEDAADQQTQNSRIVGEARATVAATVAAADVCLENGSFSALHATPTTRSGTARAGPADAAPGGRTATTVTFTDDSSFASLGGGARLRRQLQPPPAASPSALAPAAAVGPAARMLPRNTSWSDRTSAGMPSPRGSARDLNALAAGGGGWLDGERERDGARAVEREKPRRDIVQTRTKTLTGRRKTNDTVLQAAVRDTSELERVLHSEHPYLKRHGLSVFPGVMFRAAPARRRYDRVSFVSTPAEVVQNYLQHIQGGRSVLDSSTQLSASTNNSSRVRRGRVAAGGRSSEAAMSSSNRHVLSGEDAEADDDNSSMLPPSPSSLPKQQSPSSLFTTPSQTSCTQPASAAMGVGRGDGALRMAASAPSYSMRMRMGASPDSAYGGSSSNNNSPTPPRRPVGSSPTTSVPDVPRSKLSSRLDPAVTVAELLRQSNPLNPANNYPIEDADVPSVQATTPPVIVGSITAAEVQALPTNAEICLGGWLYVSLQDEQRRLRKALGAFEEKQKKKGMGEAPARPRGATAMRGDNSRQRAGTPSAQRRPRDSAVSATSGTDSSTLSPRACGTRVPSMINLNLNHSATADESGTPLECSETRLGLSTATPPSAEPNSRKKAVEATNGASRGKLDEAAEDDGEPFTRQMSDPTCLRGKASKAATAEPPPRRRAGSLFNRSRYFARPDGTDGGEDTWLPYAYVFIALPMYECSIHASAFHVSGQRTKPVSLNLENPLSRRAFGVGCVTSVRYGGVMIIECRDCVCPGDEDWVLHLIALGKERAKLDAAAAEAVARRAEDQKRKPQQDGGDDEGGSEPSTEKDDLQLPFGAGWSLLLDPSQFSRTHPQQQRADHLQAVKRRIRRRLKRLGLYVVSASTRSATRQRRAARRSVLLEVSDTLRRGGAGGGGSGALGSGGNDQPLEDGFSDDEADKNRDGNSDDEEEDRTIRGELAKARERCKRRAGSSSSTAHEPLHSSASDSDDEDGDVGETASDFSTHSAHHKTTNQRAFRRQRPQRMIRGTFRQLGGMRYLDDGALMEGCPVSEVVRGVERWIRNLLHVPVKARPLSLFLQRYEGIVMALRVAGTHLFSSSTDTSGAVLLNNMSFHGNGAGASSATGGNGGMLLSAGPSQASPLNLNRPPPGGNPSFRFAAAGQPHDGATEPHPPTNNANGSFRHLARSPQSGHAAQSGGWGDAAQAGGASGGGGGVAVRLALPYVTWYTGPLNPNVRAVLPPSVEALLHTEPPRAAAAAAAPSPGGNGSNGPDSSGRLIATVGAKTVAVATLHPVPVAMPQDSAAIHPHGPVTAPEEGGEEASGPAAPTSPSCPIVTTAPAAAAVPVPHPHAPEDGASVTAIVDSVVDALDAEVVMEQQARRVTQAAEKKRGGEDGQAAAASAAELALKLPGNGSNNGAVAAPSRRSSRLSAASPLSQPVATDASVDTIETILIRHGVGGGGGDGVDADGEAVEVAAAALLSDRASVPSSVSRDPSLAGPATTAAVSSRLGSPIPQPSPSARAESRAPAGGASGRENPLSEDGSAWRLADQELRKTKAELDEVQFLLSNAKAELQRRLEEFITVGSLFMPHTRSDQIELNVLYLKMLRHYPEEVPIKELRADWLPTMLALLTTPHEDLLAWSATGNTLEDGANACDANQRNALFMDDGSGTNDAGATPYRIESFPATPQVLRTVHGLPPLARLREMVIAPLPYRVNPETARALEHMGMDSGLSFVFTGGSLGVLAGMLTFYTDHVKRTFREQLRRVRGEVSATATVAPELASEAGVIAAAAASAKSALELLEQTHTVLLRRVVVWGATTGKKGIKTVDEWQKMHEAYYHMLDPSAKAADSPATLTPGYYLRKVAAAATGRSGEDPHMAGTIASARAKLIAKEMDLHAERVGIPFRSSECFALFDAIAYYLGTLESLEQQFSGAAPQQQARKRRSLFNQFLKKDTGLNGGGSGSHNASPASATARRGGQGRRDAAGGQSATSSPANSNNEAEPDGGLSGGGAPHPLLTGPFVLTIGTNYYYKAALEERQQPQVMPGALLPAAPPARPAMQPTTARWPPPRPQGNPLPAPLRSPYHFPPADDTDDVQEWSVDGKDNLSAPASHTRTGRRGGGGGGGRAAAGDVGAAVPSTPCITPVRANVAAKAGAGRRRPLPAADVDDARGGHDDPAGWRRLVGLGGSHAHDTATRAGAKRRKRGKHGVGKAERRKGNGEIAGAEVPYCGGEEAAPEGDINAKLHKDSKKLFHFLEECLEKWKRQSESNGSSGAAYAKRIRLSYE